MINRNTKVALLAGIAAAVVAGVVLAQPSITAMASSQNATGDDSELTTFEEEAIEAGAEFEDMTMADNATADNETAENVTTDVIEDQPTITANDTTDDTISDDNATAVIEIEPTETANVTAGENGTIVLQGTVSSPGPEAGPFQIVDLLPPSLDGNIYTGWVSFTATEPLLVAPLQTYGVANETIDPEFGQLFVFPGIPNGTMIAPAITMPDYADQEAFGSPDVPMPDEMYAATVPFTGSGLSVGRLDGEPFIVSYTLYATTHAAQNTDNVESAIGNQTEISGAGADIVSGSAFLNETAYSPNPIEIDDGDSVTWINRDFDPHTVTSGSYLDDDAGEEFDSGYMGPQASFTHTFEDEGEYDYFCMLHPNMVGTVQVD